MSLMLSLSPQGLFCEAGGFHIDPHRPVPIALITHAHSDHARRGAKLYVCVKSGAGLLRRRVGLKVAVREVEYGETLLFGDVRVSFHPAGHILGSAQVRVEHRGEVWVASGDYKRDPDPSCEPFEVVRCDTFVTEATFGTPKYRWGDTSGLAGEIIDWWRENRALGRNSVVCAYSLGKTQRVLAELQKHGGAFEPVWLYGEGVELTECYRREGVRLVETRDLAGAPEKLEGALVVGTQSLLESEHGAKLGEYPAVAFASGWMQGGGGWSRSPYEKGFVMSDHSDWPALLRTIEETGARRVLTLHGGEGALVRHLRRLGLDAHPMSNASALRPARMVQQDLFAPRP